MSDIYLSHRSHLLYDPTWPDKETLNKLQEQNRLWDELHPCAVETSLSPDLGLITFALTASYFALIYKKARPDDAKLAVDRQRMTQDFVDAQRDGRFLDVSDHTHANLNSNTSTDTSDAEESDGEPIEVKHGTSVDALVDVAQTSSSQIEDVVVGFVYLTSLKSSLSSVANIGIIIDPQHRRCGYARQALELTLRWAFDEAKYHRVQAAVLQFPGNDKALSLFTQMRFAHEGTRRRSLFSPVSNEWKDVTYLGMLDSDWAMRSVTRHRRPAPKSMWDALLLRHEREIEELLRWDETRAFVKLTRTSSMETIRAGDTSSASRKEKERKAAVLEWENRVFGSGVDEVEEEEIIELARQMSMGEKDLEFEEEDGMDLSELEDMFGEEIQSSLDEH